MTIFGCCDECQHAGRTCRIIADRTACHALSSASIIRCNGFQGVVLWRSLSWAALAAMRARQVDRRLKSRLVSIQALSLQPNKSLLRSCLVANFPPGVALRQPTGLSSFVYRSLFAYRRCERTLGYVRNANKKRMLHVRASFICENAKTDFAVDVRYQWLLPVTFGFLPCTVGT